MNIIIAGDGKVGRLLTGQLSQEGHDITVIDKKPEVLEETMENYDVFAIEGNCASIDVLKEAGIESADLLITATSSDEVNLLCCMMGHYVNPEIHTIARIRNPEYEDSMYAMDDMLSLSLSVNPDRQAANEIFHLLKYPGFLKRDKFAKGRVEIVELRIDDSSPLVNKPLNQLEKIVHCKILVCAVTRNGECIIPSGDFVLKEEDHIYVTASADNISTLLMSLGLMTRKMKNVIIAGGSRIARYLTLRLIKSGVDVKIIESDKEKCEMLADQLPDATIVNGDASLDTTLIKEGIERCDAFVSMTGIDELNIFLSFYANSLNIPRVITKLGRGSNLDLLNRLNIGSMVSPKDLCSNTILRYVRASAHKEGAAVSMHTIADGKAETIEFIVDEETKHQHEQLKNIEFKPGVLLTSITRDRQMIFPSGNSYFQTGDRLVIVTNTTHEILNLNDIFRR